MLTTTVLVKEMVLTEVENGCGLGKGLDKCTQSRQRNELLHQVAGT